MAKDPSPLLGYNNNIRHKNRVFHIQTEDSGVRHPHIITHLFMDGGRILKSVKTSYAEHLGVEKMADLVRKMMKDQHKGMLIALRDGQFDVVIDGGEVSKPVLPNPPSSAAVLPKAASIPPAAPPAAASAPELPAEAAAPPPRVPSIAPAARAPSVRPPSVRAAPPPSVRAAPEPEALPPLPPFEASPSDLEPPPKNLFRPRTGGNYSTLGAPPDSESRAAPSPPVRTASISRPATVPPGATVSRSGAKPMVPPSRPGAPPVAVPGARQPPIRRTSSPPAPPVAPSAASRLARRPSVAPVVATKAPESRYASARPAAIFGQSRPRGGSSIFGEDIISDKSLDEVIMSYLAEDSKDPPAKPSVPPSSSNDKRRK